MMPPHILSHQFVMAFLIGMGIYCVFRFILLTFSLWMMLRMQDLNHTIPGILISAALTSACYMIPFVGKYLAAAVLFFCVKKMTEAELIDIRFTVAISYAIMFLLQMLVLSALPDHNVRARGFNDSSPRIQMTANGNTADASDDDDSDNATPTPAAVKPKTTQVSSNTPKAPVVFMATNETPTQISAKESTKNTNTTATNAAPAKLASADYAKTWKLKGVVGNGRQATAMIGVGHKTYSFGVGDKLKVDTDSGKVDVSLEAATQTYVLLNVDGVGVTLNLK